MPRGRKRKKEDNSESEREETAGGDKKEIPGKKGPVKRRKEPAISFTFKIEHW